MIDAVVAAMVGSLIAVIAFVVVNSVTATMDLTALSGAELAVLDILPVIIGVVVLIGVFTSLAMRGEGWGVPHLGPILGLPFWLTRWAIRVTIKHKTLAIPLWFMLFIIAVGLAIITSN